MCAYGEEPHWGPCEEVERRTRESEAVDHAEETRIARERKARYYGTRDPQVLSRLPDRPARAT